MVQSVLAQDTGDLELVITDNASTDDTESVCRALARADGRIRYVRQPQNIGLLPNFMFALTESRGCYFRWIGDDDWLATDYLSRCLAALADRPDAVLATTRIEYTGPGVDASVGDVLRRYRPRVHGPGGTARHDASGAQQPHLRRGSAVRAAAPGRGRRDSARQHVPGGPALQVRRPQSLPSPSFEGAGAELPASGELNLAQMSGADGRTLLRRLPGRVGRMIHCPG